MATYRTEMTTTWDAERTFAYMADFSHAAEWDPGVRSAVRLDSTAVGIGTAFCLRVAFGPATLPLEYRIVRFEPPRLVTFAAAHRWLRSTDTVTVDDEPGGGATLRYDAVLDLAGLLRVLDPLLAAVFGRIGDRAADGLRRALSGASAGELDPR